MACQHNSQVLIKDEMFGQLDVLPHSELLDSLTDETDSYEESKLLGFRAIKEEDTETIVPLPDQCLPDITSGTERATVWDSSKNARATVQKPVPHDMLSLKKLLQSTLPKKHVTSRWTKQTTNLILMFLESFVFFARRCKLTYCSDKCLALKGPRILKCDECLHEFSGLYDRYLKLFLHYKTDHKLKCNTLIGQKWNKLKATLDIMVKAWKMDLKNLGTF